MSELKLISPLLSNMEVEQCLSSRGAVSVYLVRSTKTKQAYILKHINVPESQKQVDALIYSGAAASQDEAQLYYQQVVSDYQKELETLEKLSASPNLGCYRSYQIVPKEDGVGFELYLLAEYRKTLAEFVSEGTVSYACAMNLGLDLCSALTDLRQAGLMHRNVKPTNIYLNDNGHFLLGDLGIARMDELKYCSMPESMLSSYSAPELFQLLGNVEPTSDIYSVGMILYWILNGGHGPFEDEKVSAKMADKLRISGQQLPTAMYADAALSEILNKACAFQSEDRYASPQELRDALVEYVKANEPSDAPILPPIFGQSEPVDQASEAEDVEPVQFADTEAMASDFKQSFSPDTQMLNEIIDAVHKDMSEKDAMAVADSVGSEDEDAPLISVDSSRRSKKRKRRTWAIVAASVVLLAAIAAAVWFFVLAPSVLQIDSIELTDVTTDALTVLVHSDEEDGAFGVICSDAYGNTFRQSYVAGKSNTFTDLIPGTQYSVTVEPAEGRKLRGEYVALATTTSQTEVLSFTATAISVTQAELNLILQDGPDPGVWTVSYEAEGVAPLTVTFEGHSTVIANLESDTEYTFTLQQPENTLLTGATSTRFSTVPLVSLDGNATVALSENTAVVSWKFVGDEPEEWTVTLTDPDGNTETRSVTETSVTFENLQSGKSYSVLITAPTMLDSYLLTFEPSVACIDECTVSPVTGEEEAVTGYKVAWVCKSDPLDAQWVVKLLMQGADEAETMEITTQEQSCVIDTAKLVSDALYDVSISLAGGEKLDGVTGTSFTAASKEKFQEKGIKDLYTGLFLKPEKEDFRYLDLSVMRSKFTADEAIAFDVQSISAPDTKEDEPIEVALVIRTEDGTVCDAHSYTTNWSGMWENNMFVGAFPRTPSRQGTYYLEVYLNGQFLTKAKFEIA